MSQMNKMTICIDYQTAAAADPEFEDESGHVASCAECGAFRDEILALNASLLAAMDIKVPKLTLPDLPVLDTQSITTMSERRDFSKPAWFALAATVLLAAVVGIRMTGMTETHGTLEEQVLAHVDNEASAVLASTTRVSDGQLARAVPQHLAAMNHDIGLITYAQSCRINGKEVPHLVLQGEYGPVTILLMPYERVTKASTFEGVNVKGVILPVGDGSIAIIGDRQENIEQVEKKVMNSVLWST